jgi:hypothetical protein
LIGTNRIVGRCVRRIVLAPLAAHPVRHHKLGRHQPAAVAELLELPRPMVRSRAGLHPDHARRQFGDHLHQLITPDHGAHPHRLAMLIHAVQRKHVLGKIDSNKHNSHGTLLFETSTYEMS